MISLMQVFSLHNSHVNQKLHKLFSIVSLKFIKQQQKDSQLAKSTKHETSFLAVLYSQENGPDKGSLASDSNGHTSAYIVRLVMTWQHSTQSQERIFIESSTNGSSQNHRRRFLRGLFRKIDFPSGDDSPNRKNNTCRWLKAPSFEKLVAMPQ
jgi:hypothetical protein